MSMKKQPPAFYIEVRLKGIGHAWEPAWNKVERVMRREFPDLEIASRSASVVGEQRTLVRKGGGK